MDPLIVPALITGGAVILAAVIGFFTRRKSGAEEQEPSSVKTGAIVAGRDAILSGRDTYVSQQEPFFQNGFVTLSAGEVSITVTITAVDVGRAKLVWAPPDTIRGVLVSPTSICFQRRASSGFQPEVEIDYKIED